jgi:hypothetical protein
MINSLVLAATFAASLQQAPAQPLDLLACNVTAPTSIQADSQIPGMITLPGSVTISFVNRSAQPAKSVEFALNEGGRTTMITDSGTFSQGTVITQTFDANFDNGAATCGVAAVNYSNGLAWEKN